MPLGVGRRYDAAGLALGRGVAESASPSTEDATEIWSGLQPSIVVRAESLTLRDHVALEVVAAGGEGTEGALGGVRALGHL